MKFVFWWITIAFGSATYILLMLAASPLLILGMIYSGKTDTIELLNDNLQDCFYVLGKSAKKLFKSR